MGDRLHSERSVTFHVGVPKTGSTSIQRHLASNAAHLAPELAVITPVPDLTLSRLAQHAARFSLDGDAPSESRLRDSIARLRDEVAAIRGDVLISHETLVGASPGREGEVRLFPAAATILRLVAEGFSPWRVRFVVYLRDITSWKHSMHAQAVKTDCYTGPLHQFMAETASISGWEDFMSRLRLALGDAVSFVPVENTLSDPHPARDLLTRVGVSAQRIATMRPLDARLNRRPRPAALEFIRQINMIDLSTEHRQRVVNVVKQNQSLFSSTFAPSPAEL